MSQVLLGPEEQEEEGEEAMHHEVSICLSRPLSVLDLDPQNFDDPHTNIFFLFQCVDNLKHVASLIKNAFCTKS